MKILFKLALAAALSLAAPVVHADDRLIWQFTRSSDISYLARLGGRLQTGWQSGIGADARIVGPDLRQSGNPLALWATVDIPTAQRPAGTTTRIEARIDGGTSKRSVRVTDHSVRAFPAFDLDFDRLLFLSYDPSAGAHAEVSQTSRVTLKRTRTSVLVRTSRNDRDPWQTRVAVEQRLREAIKLTGSIDRTADRKQTGRLRAEVNYRW